MASILYITYLLTLLILSSTSEDSVPCSELSRELRYPCRCALNPHDDVDRPSILMDCDNVVFPGELPALPYGAPIVAFRQRYAGHQALPPQLFGDAALPLRSIDFSNNALRRLTERMLTSVRDSLLELRLADNLLGDTLNPIFSSNEFHGLIHLQNLDLSGNTIQALEEGIFKGCDNLQELKLDRNSLVFIPSTSLNGPRGLKILSLSKNRIGTIRSGAFKAQPMMEQLDLSENFISTIDGDAFEDMEKLRILKISKNKLNRFNSDVFHGAYNLHYLDLSHNFIGEFPTVALKAFTNLRFLNLSANLIKTIDNTDFEGLINLSQLDLSRNNIANIAPGTFLGLKHLKLLDISVNSLRTIEDDAFEGLDNLERLSLKDNNILLIPASALGRLPRLSALALDYNRIAAISGDILRSMAERVTSLVLSRNVIRELPPATFQHFQQLQYLDLTGNLLTSLNPETFTGLDNTLRTLTVAQNKLTSLSSIPLSLSVLQALDLSDNKIIDVARESFSLLPSLVYLNLSGNPLTKASALPSGLFHRISFLEILDVSRAELRALPGDFLTKSSNIRNVYLNGNSLTELTEGTFLNLRNLTIVDLSNNGLTSIRPRTFINTMNIRMLRLNGNQLNSFKGEIFNTGTSLEVLDLSDNELSYLFPSSFRIHPRLKWLSLAENKLNFFPAELIAGLQYLEHIDLSNNALKTVDELDFGRLPRLRILSLSNNQLESISEMAFHNSTQLQILNLGKNKIDRLGERTFEGLIRLDVLNLESNLLEELPDSIFDRARLQMLQNINLAGNQFEIAPLKALQRQYFFVSSVDLSRNKLTNIPADDSVMVNIKKLDLSFNPLLPESVMNVLGEPKTVRELNLAGIGITQLTRLETPFLRHLNLSSNNISTIPENVFERTSLLETLDLSKNNLTMPLPNIWPLFKNIQSLNLSNNPIRTISHNDLSGLESLRYLSIENLNECIKIEKNSFKSVPNLCELNAYGYPKLGYLDVQGILEYLPALERLNLETKETALGPDQLRAALHPRLKELGIMGSRLTTVSSGTLSGLKASDIILKLRNTSLHMLPPALFFPVPRSSRVMLDLSSNMFTTLTSQTLSALDDRRGDLKVIGLDTNPIVCNCSSKALRRWLQTHSEIQVICSAPQNVAGKMLLKLNDSDLTCEKNISQQPLPHEIVTGKSTSGTISTLQVASRVTTEPEIIWSINTPMDRARPKPPLTASTGNDDTLIIGIVGGVVAFILILIITICVIRVRTNSDGGVHARYAMSAMSPMARAGSSCACSTKGAPVYAQAPYIPTGQNIGGGYAATLPHKMAGAQNIPRHAYSTMGRIPPYYPNSQSQPYFIAYPTQDEKVYR